MTFDIFTRDTYAGMIPTWILRCYGVGAVVMLSSGDPRNSGIRDDSLNMRPALAANLGLMKVHHSL